MGIVERVRSLAEKNGHTIASVERELGFGQGSIRNWNKAAPSADKLYKVAKLFNVSMEYILTGEGQAAEKDADAIRGISDDARKACIHCFCCQEFCPKGAMGVSRPFIARLLNK